MRNKNLATQFGGEESDPLTSAIRLMSQALELIDSDPTISSLTGARIQMVIDSLWLQVSAGPPLMDLPTARQGPGSN